MRLTPPRLANRRIAGYRDTVCLCAANLGNSTDTVAEVSAEAFCGFAQALAAFSLSTFSA